MIIIVLIKFIRILSIQVKQNTINLLKKIKKLVLKSKKI